MRLIDACESTIQKLVSFQNLSSLSTPVPCLAPDRLVSVSTKATSRPTVQTCQECESQPVTIYCPECEQQLCSQCSETLHKKGARSRHAIQMMQSSTTSVEATTTSSDLREFSDVPLEQKALRDNSDEKVPDDGMFAEDADVGDVDRTPCLVCGRKFITDRLHIHERICRKNEEKKESKNSKHKVWNGAARRVKDTEFAQFARKRAPTPPQVREWRKNGRRWRQEMVEFEQVIETNKALAEMKEQGLLDEKPKARFRETVGMHGRSSGPHQKGDQTSSRSTKGDLVWEVDNNNATGVAQPTSKAATRDRPAIGRAAAPPRARQSTLPKAAASVDDYSADATPRPPPVKSRSAVLKESTTPAAVHVVEQSLPPAAGPPTVSRDRSTSSAKCKTAEKPTNPPATVDSHPTTSSANVAGASASAPKSSSAPTNDPFRFEREKRERARTRAAARREQTASEAPNAEPSPAAAAARTVVRSEYTNRMIARERGEQALATVRIAKQLTDATQSSGKPAATSVRRSSGSAVGSVAKRAPSMMSPARAQPRTQSGSSVRRAPSPSPASQAHPRPQGGSSMRRSSSVTRSGSALSLSGRNEVNSNSAQRRRSSSKMSLPNDLPSALSLHALTTSTSSVSLPPPPSVSSSLTAASTEVSISSNHVSASRVGSMEEYLQREKTRAAQNGRRNHVSDRTTHPKTEQSAAMHMAPTERKLASAEHKTHPLAVAAASSELTNPQSQSHSTSSAQSPVVPSKKAAAFDIAVNDGSEVRVKPKLTSSGTKKPPSSSTTTSPAFGLQVRDGIAQAAPGPKLKATLVDGKIFRVLQHPTTSDDSSTSQTTSTSDAPTASAAPKQWGTDGVRASRTAFLDRLQTQQV